MPGEVLEVPLERAQRRRRVYAQLSACFLVLAIFLRQGHAVALAGEAVSMPYRCFVSSGVVHLEPSGEQIYRIVGKRQEKAISPCGGSSDGQARCQAITIHRFAFDCAGTEITWMEAAASTTRGRPWAAQLADGRMTLRMVSLGKTRTRAEPLVLPAGFAPAPDRGFRFVPVVDPPADKPAPARRAPAAPDVPQEIAKAESRPMLALLPPAMPPPLPPVAQASPEPLPIEMLESVEPATAPHARVPRAADGWTAKVEADSVPGSGIAGLGQPSRLIVLVCLAAVLLSASALAMRQKLVLRNLAEADGTEADGDDAPGAAREEPATDIPPPPRPARAEAPTLGLDAPTGQAEAATATAGVAPPPLPRAFPAGRHHQGESVELEPADDLLRHPLHQEAVSQEIMPQETVPMSSWEHVNDLKETAEALTGLLDQLLRDHVPEGPLRDVLVADLASNVERLHGADLDRAWADGRPDLAEAIYGQIVAELERARILARIEYERALTVRDHAGSELDSIEAAFAFLGVNPTAEPEVVRKAVLALRQNWHPDLARDDADRVSREERIKQINAAWDLIRAR